MAAALPIPDINLTSHLSCVKCGRISVTPIYSCEKGHHIICGICLDKEKDLTCPGCKGSLRPNAFLDRVYEKEGVKLPCYNQIYGCPMTLKAGFVKEHCLEVCAYKPLLCQENCAGSRSACSGKQYYGPKQLVHHWKEDHGIWQVPVIAGSGSHSCMLYQPQLAFLDREDHAWRTSYFEHDSRTFFIHMVMQKSIMFIWITCLASETMAKAYELTVEVHQFGSVDHKPKISWTIPAHSVQCYTRDRIRATGDVCVFYSAMLKPTKPVNDMDLQAAVAMFPNNDAAHTRKQIQAGNWVLWNLRVDVKSTTNRSRKSLHTLAPRN